MNGPRDEEPGWTAPDSGFLLGQARVALRSCSEWSAEEERALAERVLRATTRARPSWRGELRLFSGFVRRRLMESPGLRLIAASLLLHFLALPVLAYLTLLHERPPRFVIRIEPPPQGETPAAVADLEDPLAPATADARSREALVNALARSRFVLQTRGANAPLLEARPGDSSELRGLVARSRGLRGAGREASLEGSAELADASALALALHAQTLLDRFVLERQRCASWSTLLFLLERRASAADAADPADRLVLAALERARSLGLADTPAGAAAGSSLDAPLSEREFVDLAAAAERAGCAGDPRVRAWCEWRGR